jgi:hypothetical protein
MDFIELVKGFILSPVENFHKVGPADLGDTLKYYLILLVINTVLTVIVSLVALSAVWAAINALFPSLGLGAPTLAGFGIVIFAILMIFVYLLLLFIGAGWVHIWVYILGGRKGYMQTLKAIAYGDTPNLLLGWIPVVSIIGAIWSFVLWIIGVRELHEMSTGRAAAAVILAAVIIAIIIFIVAAALFFTAVSMFPLPAGPYGPMPGY